MLSDPTRFCRVCGFEQPHPQYGLDGRTPTYEICDCCGVEFGYGDTILPAIEAWREKWIASGQQWTDPGLKPQDWSWEDQKRNIPSQFALAG